MSYLPEIWLATLLIVSLGYAVWLMARSDYSPWESTLFLPAYLLARLLWRVEFTNQSPPEMRTGAILAANHRSSVDPMFIQLAARRRVHWMVAKEYCQHFLFGPILKALQVIPTNRTGTDIASTKMAIRYASQKRLVGMFPEGRINRTNQPLIAIRAGAAVVAIKAQVPIIPIYIEGSPYSEVYSVLSPFLMPSRVRVTFGQPIFSEHPCELRPIREAEDENHQGPEQPERLIKAWADQIVALSGAEGFEVPIGSAARSRKKRD